MRFVPVKSEEQQASTIVFRAHDLLIRQRTQLGNALRGLVAEFGWIAPKGLFHMADPMGRIEDPTCALPQSARGVFVMMTHSIRDLARYPPPARTSSKNDKCPLVLGRAAHSLGMGTGEQHEARTE